jgi:hypothetical protein
MNSFLLKYEDPRTSSSIVLSIDHTIMKKESRMLGEKLQNSFTMYRKGKYLQIREVFLTNVESLKLGSSP